MQNTHKQDQKDAQTNPCSTPYHRQGQRNRLQAVAATHPKKNTRWHFTHTVQPACLHTPYHTTQPVVTVNRVQTSSPGLVLSADAAYAATVLGKDSSTDTVHKPCSA